MSEPTARYYTDAGAVCVIPWIDHRLHTYVKFKWLFGRLILTIPFCTALESVFSLVYCAGFWYISLNNCPEKYICQCRCKSQVTNLVLSPDCSSLVTAIGPFFAHDWSSGPAACWGADLGPSSLNFSYQRLRLCKSVFVPYTIIEFI